MILVTGANGFLGARIVRLLCAAGHEVRAAGHPDDPDDLVRELGCSFEPFDLLDARAMAHALRGIDTVFHAAAMVTFRPECYEEQMRVNVHGTRLLLAAARAASVRRFVYTSTVNTLGVPAPDRVGDEQTTFNWGRYRLGYMDSKHDAEALVLEAAGKGLPAICLLPGTFFGPGDIHFNAGTYIREVARGRAFFAPSGGTTVVHVDDVARGHLLGLERGRAGERYVLGGEFVSYRTLFTWIAEELGRSPPLGTLPGPVLRGAGRLLDLVRKKTPWSPPFSEGLAVAGSAELYYSSAKARRELGYRARPAREAIRDAVLWYHERELISP